MKVELRDEYSTPNPDELAAMSARGDYMDQSLVGTPYDEAMGDRDLQDFLNEKAYSGHFGVFEHPQASFFVEGLSRSAMAQVTRHRHMSFDVQSQRYVDFAEKEPVVPPSFRETNSGTFPMGEAQSPIAVGPSANKTWEDMLQTHWKLSVERYKAALDTGIPKEDARFFLPLAAPVNMTLSANPRALFHFLDLRDNAKAQWEAQQFAKKIGDVASDWAPKSFRAYDEKTNNNSLRAP
jgi:thymidylate synthase (FAD)